MDTHFKPKQRILLADDDLAFQILMEQAITDAGFEVTCVNNGDQALESAVEAPPDLIFLDHLMPELTGLEACAEIRTRLEGSCPPIVMVTGCDGEQAIADAFAAGATDYLVKPVNWLLFQYRLAGWLATQASLSPTVPTLNRTHIELLLSGKGDLLDVVTAGDLQVAEHQASTHTFLSELLPDSVLTPILTAIKRVLRTRESRNEQHDLELCSRFSTWNFRIEARGRDKVSLVIEPTTKGQESRSHLFRMAYVEASTGLPNLHLFSLTAKDRLEKARFQNREIAVLCLVFAERNTRAADKSVLDKSIDAVVSTINDKLREKNLVTKFDVPNSKSPCIASCDHGQFFVLIEQDTSGHKIADVVETIKLACAKTDNRAALSPRIGYARYPDDGAEIELLIESARVAANTSLADQAICNRAGERLSDRPTHMDDDIEFELIDALEKEQLQVYFQPLVDLDNGCVAGVEALIRWPHPLLGQISAGELFGRLNSGEAIRRLSDWALKTACQHAKDWQDVGLAFKVSVNLSQEQVIREDFADYVLQLINTYGPRPEAIQLEVTDALLNCNQYSMDQFVELADAGVGIIVDDFDTARVSVDALRRLAVKSFKVKCTRSLHEAQGDDSGVFSIARAISLECEAQLIAKNIESADDLELARSRACDQGQGFHICQPLPADQLAEYVAELALNQSSSLDIAAAI